MKIGTRVLYPEEVDQYQADLVQISVYRRFHDNIDMMKRCVERCRKKGVRYVIHPVQYRLRDSDVLDDLREMADASDLALILHDERGPGNSRLTDRETESFLDILTDLRSRAEISFENAACTADVHWFWDNFADSITLDIGHVESSGMNSSVFVQSLGMETIDKIRFVHVHRNNGLRGGITDHWPVTPGCREIQALKDLLKRREDISVILEINEIESIADGLTLLKSIKDSLSSGGQ